MSDASIELLNPDKAAGFVFTAALAEMGFGVQLLKGRLLAFNQSMYDQGYLLISITPEAQAILDVSLKNSKNPCVSCVTVFAHSYAQQFLLAQAEKSQLPVALIQVQLLKVLNNLYCNGFAFGYVEQEAALKKIQDVFVFPDKKVILTINQKEQEQNAEGSSTQEGRGVQDSGSGAAGSASADSPCCAPSSGT